MSSRLSSSSEASSRSGYSPSPRPYVGRSNSMDSEIEVLANGRELPGRGEGGEIQPLFPASISISFDPSIGAPKFDQPSPTSSHLATVGSRSAEVGLTDESSGDSSSESSSDSSSSSGEEDEMDGEQMVVREEGGDELNEGEAFAATLPKNMSKLTAAHLSQIREIYRIPEDFHMRPAREGEPSCADLENEVAVYEDCLVASLRYPIDD